MYVCIYNVAGMEENSGKTQENVAGLADEQQHLLWLVNTFIRHNKQTLKDEKVKKNEK